jgi:hypothetical protein
MTRRPRSLGSRAGRGGGRGGSISPPAPEVPLQIPGLKAWFDSRSIDYFALGAGNAVNTWISRAGSIAGLAWTQGTASNQPVRVASEPTMNGMPAVLFDGVNDWFDTSQQNAWTFRHDGTGATGFWVYRMDSTGGANQRLLSTIITATDVGFAETYGAGLSLYVYNGSGTLVNSMSVATPAHFARDVSRWQLTGYGAGMQHSRVSGSSLTNADTAPPPSSAAPSRVCRLGASPSAGSVPFKGLLPQLLLYDRVLTAGETSTLVNHFAPIYAIAA